MTADPLDLDAIEARATAATKPPWEFFWPGQCCDGYCLDEVGIHSASMGMSDAVFIAAARTDVPALVAELREARAKLAAIEDAWPSPDAPVYADELSKFVARLTAIIDGTP